MQDFVTAYNGAIAAINTATKYDIENKEPSSLTGDAQMRGASSQLRSMMGGILKDLSAAGLDPKKIGLQ
ncbi:flagellar hook protein FliD, partial [Mycobacterium tuberculosis]